MQSDVDVLCLSHVLYTLWLGDCSQSIRVGCSHFNHLISSMLSVILYV